VGQSYVSDVGLKAHLERVDGQCGVSSCGHLIAMCDIEFSAMTSKGFQGDSRGFKMVLI
jgi:hypothetical protein